MMRRFLPYVLALVLGAGAALLAACGDSTRGGIPAADAADLNSQLEDVRDRVDDGNCDELSGQLRQVDNGIDDLPRSVDNRLIESLRDGADRLQRRAVQECNENRTPTQTEPAETVTEEEPVQTQAPPRTQTTPPETTTQPPQNTVTTPPAPPVQPPPADDPEPPPDVGQGGGTPPEVP